MSEYSYYEISECLKTGREVEFSHNGKNYSVTNSEGFWYLSNDTDRIVIERLCLSAEREYLARRVGEIELDGVTVREIFDKKLYEESGLYIL